MFAHTRSKTAVAFPPFRPHPLLKSGHAQTLAAAFLHGTPRVRTAETHHEVRLDDGDHVVLHDDRPVGWQAGAAVALLLHGLTGCHRSAYLFRAARKLNQRGVRTLRMDYRSCGAGIHLSTRPYHAGLSDDALAALHVVARTEDTLRVAEIRALNLDDVRQPRRAVAPGRQEQAAHRPGVAREQSRSDHDGRVRGIRAARDRRNDDGAVVEPV